MYTYMHNICDHAQKSLTQLNTHQNNFFFLHLNVPWHPSDDFSKFIAIHCLIVSMSRLFLCLLKE